MASLAAAQEKARGFAGQESVVKAKGAFTWAVALGEEKGTTFQLAGKQFPQLLEINRE